jgi:hypothetical protein
MSLAKLNAGLCADENGLDEMRQVSDETAPDELKLLDCK